MTAISPKSPRIRDEKYLAWIRKQPCCTCGGKSEAAHIRSGSIAYGKRETGLGEKPDDRWSVPACRSCHVTQHNMNELEYWRQRGIDPFALAIKYFDRAVMEGQSKPSTRKPRKTIVPKGYGPRIPSRPFGKAQRKFGQ